MLYCEWFRVSFTSHDRQKSWLMPNLILKAQAQKLRCFVWSSVPELVACMEMFERMSDERCFLMISQAPSASAWRASIHRHNHHQHKNIKSFCSSCQNSAINLASTYKVCHGVLNHLSLFWFVCSSICVNILCLSFVYKF